MAEIFKSLPDVLRAVTDPFSLLALIVLVLGWVAHSTIKSTLEKARRNNPLLLLIPLSIVAVSFLALAFNVIRIGSLQRTSTSLTSANKYIVQVTFRGVTKQKQAVTVPFRTSSGQLNVGCGESAATAVSWNVPAGSREINPRASWERTDNLKGASQQATVNGNAAVASGTISGQDRQWTGNCPGGGHGELVLSGTYVTDEESADVSTVIGTLQDTISDHGHATFEVPALPGSAIQEANIAITSTSTNLQGSLRVGLRVDSTGRIVITDPPPQDSKTQVQVSGKSLVISVP